MVLGAVDVGGAIITDVDTYAQEPVRNLQDLCVVQADAGVTQQSVRSDIDQCVYFINNLEKCPAPPISGFDYCEQHKPQLQHRQTKLNKAKVAAFGYIADVTKVSVVDELTRLAQMKLNDVMALRVKISEDDITDHIGMIDDSFTEVAQGADNGENSFRSTTSTKRDKSSPWLKELHTAEAELITILKLLADITPEATSDISRQIRQSVREGVRISRTHSNMTIEQIVLELTKNT